MNTRRGIGGIRLLKRMCRSTEAFNENGKLEKPMENYTQEIEEIVSREMRNAMKY